MSKKVYVLLYNSEVGTREELRAWADSSPLVYTWRYDLPHCFYLISDSTSEEIGREFRTHTGEKGRFLIMETNKNRYGWMPEDTWKFLRRTE